MIVIIVNHRAEHSSTPRLYSVHKKITQVMLFCSLVVEKPNKNKPLSLLALKIVNCFVCRIFELDNYKMVSIINCIRPHI